MRNTLYRAQILLEPEQHEALAEIARQENRSISEVVRAALREWLSEHQESEAVRQQLEALKVIQAHREELLARRGGQPLEIDAAALLGAVREERANELLGNAFGSGD